MQRKGVRCVLCGFIFNCTAVKTVLDIQNHKSEINFKETTVNRGFFDFAYFISRKAALFCKVIVRNCADHCRRKQYQSCESGFMHNEPKVHCDQLERM